MRECLTFLSKSLISRRLKRGFQLAASPYVLVSWGQNPLLHLRGEAEFRTLNIEKMQWIGKAMPLYYAADALRKVVILNAGLYVIGRDLMILVAYALIIH